jgi:hypothetical protein
MVSRRFFRQHQPRVKLFFRRGVIHNAPTISFETSMDRLQHTDRSKAKRNRLIWILGLAPLICLLACLLSMWACFEFCLIGDGQPRADFRRFGSASALETYINQNLVEGQSSIADVQEFIEQEGILSCRDERGNFRCLVFAPEEIPSNLDWRERLQVRIDNKLFKIFYYEIRFYSDRNKDILSRITVNRHQGWVTWP